KESNEIVVQGNIDIIQAPIIPVEVSCAKVESHCTSELEGHQVPIIIVEAKSVGCSVIEQTQVKKLKSSQANERLIRERAKDKIQEAFEKAERERKIIQEHELL